MQPASFTSRHNLYKKTVCFVTWSPQLLHLLQLTQIRHSQADGSSMARFPWKPNHPPLPTNGTLCERRTQVLARRLAMSPDLLNQYSTILNDQECFGFIEKVNSPPVVSRCHYIPHHVVKKDLPTTPIRVLYMIVAATNLASYLV